MCEQIPDEPRGRDPDIECRVQAVGRDDLNLDEDINEREQREHGLRSIPRDGVEDCGKSEGLIEDPSEGGD